MNTARRAATAALGLTTLVASTLVATTGIAHASEFAGSCAGGTLGNGRIEVYKEHYKIDFYYRIIALRGRNNANVKVSHGDWFAYTGKGKQDEQLHKLGTRNLSYKDERATYQFSFVFDKSFEDPRCSGTFTV